MRLFRLLKRGIKLNEALDCINLIASVFFGYGFLCSNSPLFKVLGGIFMIWGTFYSIFSYCRIKKWFVLKC